MISLLKFVIFCFNSAFSFAAMLFFNYRGGEYGGKIFSETNDFDSGEGNMVVWPNILEEIRKKSNPQVRFWFDKLIFHSQTENTVTLHTKSSFDRDWIQNNYIDLIQETITDVQGKNFTVYIDSENETPINTDTETHTRRAGVHPSNSLYTGIINPNYNFDSFIVGSSNQFAHAACVAIAANPGQAYNPLFIYGGVGLGKTHLLNAIANHLLEHRPPGMTRICCISAEHFTNQVINSIKTGKMEEFRNRYRFGCDVLMIDDIQFITGKESTQEEFFHTFNSLYELKKQIVLTSDKTPKDMPKIEERLRSRFEWGIITDIQPPDTETKVAILEKKAESEGLILPKDVALYIAEQITSNIRELEGTLTNIKAYANLLDTKITINLTKEVLKNIVKDSPDKALTVAMILKEVAVYFGIKTHEIKSTQKTKHIALPRQIAMYLARKLTSSSYPAIGSEFGGKDHSTVIHAVKKIEKLIENDPAFKKTVDSINAKIHNDLL